MKEVSDYVGAIIRLGVLSIFIFFLIDRISEYTIGTSGYFLSLGCFILILSVTWIALAVRIFLFTLLHVCRFLFPFRMFEEFEAEAPEPTFPK